MTPSYTPTNGDKIESRSKIKLSTISKSPTAINASGFSVTAVINRP